MSENKKKQSEKSQNDSTSTSRAEKKDDTSDLQTEKRVAPTLPDPTEISWTIRENKEENADDKRVTEYRE